MRNFIKHTLNSHVWHYSNVQRSAKYPTNISMSMCGTLYRNDKKDMNAPVCKRCLGVGGSSLVDNWLRVLKPKAKLPKLIREQSFEPPEMV